MCIIVIYFHKKTNNIKLRTRNTAIKTTICYNTFTDDVQELNWIEQEAPKKYGGIMEEYDLSASSPWREREEGIVREIIKGRQIKV